MLQVRLIRLETKQCHIPSTPIKVGQRTPRYDYPTLRRALLRAQSALIDYTILRDN
jgi:hypothetical protein